MPTYTIRKLLPMLLLLTTLGACNKLLEVPPPPSEVDITQSFNDSSSAVAAIAGIYNEMVTHGFFEWSGMAYNTSRSADDTRYDFPYDFYYLDSLQYDDQEIQTMWKQAFSGLLLINTCIRALQSPTRLAPTVHRQLLGESLFCRAFVYFNMVNLWGDALPLLTTPESEKNQLAPSVPQQRVYDQIIADLQQAQTLLTNAYAGKGRVRPNLQAAHALLARVYLYQKRYNEAITEAGTVIGSGLYSPLPAAGSAFLLSSKEAIWQLMPPVGTGAEGAVADVKLYKNTKTSLTPQLLSAFEPGDLRRQQWVTDNVYQLVTYTTANKYKDKGRTDNTTPTEYYIVLRLAEQYLVRAEAYTRLGQVEAAVADLNVVRARAGLQALPASLTQQECMQAVEQERRVELFTEWGHRWFDLKRWPGFANPNITRADEVLGVMKRDWQPTDQWYPVPKNELLKNTNLVQNPGYPGR